MSEFRDIYTVIQYCAFCRKTTVRSYVLIGAVMRALKSWMWCRRLWRYRIGARDGGCVACYTVRRKRAQP